MEEKTFKIYEDTVLNNIHWMELEVEAYKNVANGFLVLSELPEIDEFVSRKYYNEYQKYIAFWQEASDSLGELYLTTSKKIG